jgi:hypothetical protein
MAIGIKEAITDCGLSFFEVNGQRLFPVFCTEGGHLDSRNVSYLRKQVCGQDGPSDAPMPFDPPITKLKGTTVCAIVFSINDTYETAMEKLAAAAKLMEAA